MTLVLLLGTAGAGLGLAVSLALNLRLARALGAPIGASFVNFAVGAGVLLLLWSLGVDGARPTSAPPFWMLAGGVLGATYVSIGLPSAARLGVAVSSVAVTLGQVMGALVISTAGWLGQTQQRPTGAGLLSAGLLVGAVAVLAVDRSSQGKSLAPRSQAAR